ncbi:Fic family protein [Candidatus Roizmanbacteria bacterium]|nr:Fic family protein [Candidatus Roizmanbacteria bacterium]
MFAPKFSFTPQIINQLTLIERLYGQLTAEALIPSLTLKLSQENQILATHYSTSIEGNPLSPMDVTNIILNDQIPVTKLEKEVKNYFTVLNTIFLMAKKKEPLTTDLTKKLHHELMNDIEKKDLGEFRDGGVFVGHRTSTEIVVKHNPPFHTAKEIEKALGELFDWMMGADPTHPLLKAGIMHHQFVYIHPFLDGNGRLARILTAYYLLLKHYEVTKFFILDDYYDIDRHLYSDTLHLADKGDETDWLEYFLEGIANSLQAAIARINELKNSRFEEVTGEKRVLVTAREEEVLQIVLNKKAVKTTDVQKELEVSRQQAHSLLSSLVKKEILQKFGKTKTSYYKLKGEKKA